MRESSEPVSRVVDKAPIDRVRAELTRTDVVLPFFFGSRRGTTRPAVGAPPG